MSRPTTPEIIEALEKQVMEIVRSQMEAGKQEEALDVAERVWFRKYAEGQEQADPEPAETGAEAGSDLAPPIQPPSAGSWRIEYHVQGPELVMAPPIPLEPITTEGIKFWGRHAMESLELRRPYSSTALRFEEGLKSKESVESSVEDKSITPEEEKKKEDKSEKKELERKTKVRKIEKLTPTIQDKGHVMAAAAGNYQKGLSAPEGEQGACSVVGQPRTIAEDWDVSELQQSEDAVKELNDYVERINGREILETPPVAETAGTSGLGPVGGERTSRPTSVLLWTNQPNNPGILNQPSQKRPTHPWQVETSSRLFSNVPPPRQSVPTWQPRDNAQATNVAGSSPATHQEAWPINPPDSRYVPIDTWSTTAKQQEEPPKANLEGLWVRKADGVHKKKYNPKRAFVEDDYEPCNWAVPTPSPPLGPPVREEPRREEWHASTRREDQRPKKQPRIRRGVICGGLEYVPIDFAIDPPPYHCFNCWQRGHSRRLCPFEWIANYCFNCGRRGVDLSNCPRCWRAYERYLKEKFPQDRGERTTRPDEERERVQPQETSGTSGGSGQDRQPAGGPPPPPSQVPPVQVQPPAEPVQSRTMALLHRIEAMPVATQVAIIDLVLEEKEEERRRREDR